MNRSGKLHALLATSRVANIPSVISNVWLGVALGWLVVGRDPFPWWDVLLLIAAGTLLYIAGNFFNDWMDRDWDVKHRPERALPRGLFPAPQYLTSAVILSLFGVGLAAYVHSRSGIVAGLIVFCIGIYTLFHKRTAWAVIPMGLCRALLPVMGAMLFTPYIDMIWAAAAGLFFYIMGLSLSARYESMSQPPRFVQVMARTLLLVTVISMAWTNRHLYSPVPLSIAAALPYLIWTSLCLRIWRKPVPTLVSRLLAGIPLVDWIVLLTVSASIVFHGADGWEMFTLTCFALPPLAFISALLLQRLAPAT